MSVQGERGAALVVALWSAVILALIAAGLSRLAHDDLVLARNLNETVRAELAADSGVSAALHALSGPEPWPADGSVRSLVLEGTEIRIAVTDEARRLDLNSAEETSLAELLRRAGETEEVARRLAGAIVARRADEDIDDVGEENAPSFALVQDLLGIPGVTPAILSRIEEGVTVYGGARTLAGGESDEPEPLQPADAVEGVATNGNTERVFESGSEGLLRIRSEAMTEAGAVAIRIGVFALRATPPSVETRLWTRGERRLFPLPAY